MNEHTGSWIGERLWGLTGGPGNEHVTAEIFVTEYDGIGISVGGLVRVKDVYAWHKLPSEIEDLKSKISALTKAGDDMAEQIGYIGNYRDDMKRVEAWHEAKKG